MNKVILMGRLTADPELKQSAGGLSVTRFIVAVDRRYNKDGESRADFITCVAWRQTAEFVCKYFHKGKQILLEGQIQTRSWDGDDGRKRYATEVLVDSVEFVGPKTEPENNTYPYGGSAAGYRSATTPAEAGDIDGFEDIDANEDDLPF